jgi:16S rRNA (cytosine967-C5)-methyltransferase
VVRKDRRPGGLRPIASRKVAEGAIALLDAISASREPADRVRHKWMRDHHRGFDEAERDALIQLSEDILRHRGRIDWWLVQGKTALPPDNRLRLAAWRILQMGAKVEGLLPLFPPDDAIAALLRRLEGHTLEHPDMPAAARASIPDWILPLFRQRFGADLELELAAMLRPAPLDLRFNPLKTTRQAAGAALQAEGLQNQPTPFSPLGLRLSPRAYANNTQAYADGLVEPQDEGSQLAAQLVEAGGCKFVVDFCAGAGGKTLVMAAAMKNVGKLVAMDINAGRLAQARLRLRRAGVHNAETRELDGKWIKRHAGMADRVLVDAPCTGSGTWRRKPDAKWRLEQRDLDELVPRQAEILDRAAKLVQPGGRLIYVTCSVLKPENEEQVEAFITRHPDFRIMGVTDIWTRVIGSACPVPGPYLTLSPGRQGTDGFFAAVLLRDT